MTYFWKTLTLAKSQDDFLTNSVRVLLHVSRPFACACTIIHEFHDLVTLTFYLLLKNLKLGHNILTRRDRAFLLHMSIAWDKTFYVVQNVIYIVTLTFRFDILLKNFNLGCYLIMVAARQAPLSSDNSYYQSPTTLNKTTYIRDFLI